MLPILGIHHQAAHVALDIADEVVGELLVEIIVHDGIRDVRPAVLDVPPDDAGLRGELLAAPEFHEILHRLGLHDLRAENEVLQSGGALPEEQALLVDHQIVTVIGLAQFGEAPHALGEPFLVPVLLRIHGVQDGTPFHCEGGTVLHRRARDRRHGLRLGLQLFRTQPGIDAVRAHHLLQAGDVRRPVVTDLADEDAAGLGVEGRLVIAARAPEVVLRQVFVVDEAPLPHFFGVIGGAGDEGSRRVELPEDLGDDIAADVVPVGVGVETGDGAAQRVIDLVVAGPERDGRVAAELQHDGLGLVPDAPAEALVLGIGVAGEGEVLPDHDAVAVAEFIEAVVLIHVAAPAAYHVAVQVRAERDGLVHPLRVAAVEGVQRHPVGAVDEDGLPVDDEAEAPGRLREVDFVEIELHLADADPLLVHGQDGAVVGDQFAAGVVQGRLAVATRPPEVDVVEVDLLPQGVIDAGLGALVDDLAVPAQGPDRAGVVEALHGHLVLRIREDFSRPGRYIHIGRHPIHVAEVDGLDRAERDASPQAGADHAGQDVPAEGVRGLADIDALRRRGMAEADGPEEGFAPVQDGGLDDDFKAVAFRLEQVGDVEDVLDHHVLRAPYVLPVEPDVGNGVDAVEAQVETLSHLRRRSGE